MPVRYGYRVEMKFPKEPWWSYAAWTATEDEANEVARRCTYPGAQVRVRPNPDPPFGHIDPNTGEQEKFQGELF